METDHNHVCKFCMKYFLQVNSYKHGNDAEHWGYV